MRAPCVRCGHILHTGEGRVTVSFTVSELEELALSTSDPSVRRRLICAIGLLDSVRQVETEVAARELP